LSSWGYPSGESGLEGLLIAPGDPEASVLLRRVRSVDLTLRMPPLARNRIDSEYVDILERWILSL
jgi:hypothetical protein